MMIVIIIIIVITLLLLFMRCAPSPPDGYTHVRTGTSGAAFGHGFADARTADGRISTVDKMFCNSYTYVFAWFSLRFHTRRSRVIYIVFVMSRRQWQGHSFTIQGRTGEEFQIEIQKYSSADVFLFLISISATGVFINLILYSCILFNGIISKRKVRTR